MLKMGSEKINNLKTGDQRTLAPMVSPSESFDQIQIAEYLDNQTTLLWCHVPNGGARHKGAAGKLKAEGVKKGVQDILIFTPPPSGKYIGVAIGSETSRCGDFER